MFIDTPAIPMILEILRPASVLSVEPPGSPDGAWKAEIQRFVFPQNASDASQNRKVQDNPSGSLPLCLDDLAGASEQFDLVLGGFIDSEIGHFFRDNQYPHAVKLADLPANALEILEERQAKLGLLSKVAAGGYVVCQFHPDAFACKSTREVIGRQGLFVLGSCQVDLWKKASCLTFLSKRKPTGVFSLLVYKDDDPRIRAFIDFLTGKSADKPEGLIEALPEKFRAPAVAGLLQSYLQQARKLGVRLVQPLEDMNADLPLNVLMDAFNDTEPGSDELLEDAQPGADSVEAQTSVLEREELAYRYLKCWFYSDLGETYASILRTKGETNSAWPTDLLPPVPIPDAATCCRVLSLQEEVRRLEVRTNGLKEAIWSSPSKVGEHEDAFKKINIPEDDPGWVAETPFPLASILWQIRNAPNEKERMALLLKFFEGLASFHATILMSAANRSPAIKVELRSILKELEARNQSILMATFGTWSNTFGRLAKVVRQGVSGSTQDARESGFMEAIGIQDAKTVQALVSKELAELFMATNHLRNRITGHGPLITERLAAIHVDELMRLLNRWRSKSAWVWATVRILQATNNSFKRAGQYHVNARLLTGNQQPFPAEIVILDDTPDCDYVHLHNKGSNQTLQLIPFIRICEPPPGTQMACYFYNRSDAQGAHYVTYYANQAPEEVFSEDPASMLYKLLE